MRQFFSIRHDGKFIGGKGWVETGEKLPERFPKGHTKGIFSPSSEHSHLCDT